MQQNSIQNGYWLRLAFVVLHVPHVPGRAIQLLHFGSFRYRQDHKVVPLVIGKPREFDQNLLRHKPAAAKSTAPKHHRVPPMSQMPARAK